MTNSQLLYEAEVLFAQMLQNIPDLKQREAIGNTVNMMCDLREAKGTSKCLGMVKTTIGMQPEYPANNTYPVALGQGQPATEFDVTKHIQP